MSEIAEESDEEGSFVVENRQVSRAKTVHPSKTPAQRFEEDENVQSENFEIQNTNVQKVIRSAIKPLTAINTIKPEIKREKSPQIMDTPLFNTDNLELVLSNKLSPEDSLQMAINDNESIRPMKASIWEKMGFSNTKRDKMQIQKAIEGLQSVNNMHEQYIKQKEDLELEKEDFERRYLLQKSTNKGTLKTTKRLEKKLWQREERKDDVGCSIDDEIRTEIELNIELSEELDQLRLQYECHNDNKRAQEELLRMRACELEEILSKVKADNSSAQERYQSNMDAQEEIQYQMELQNYQSNQVEFSSRIFFESLSYFQETQNDSSLDFCKGIQELYSEIEKAIDYKNEIMKTAVTDPKSVVPYYRIAD